MPDDDDNFRESIRAIKPLGSEFMSGMIGWGKGGYSGILPSGSLVNIEKNTKLSVSTTLGRGTSEPSSSHNDMDDIGLGLITDQNCLGLLRSISGNVHEKNDCLALAACHRKFFRQIATLTMSADR